MPYTPYHTERKNSVPFVTEPIFLSEKSDDTSPYRLLQDRRANVLRNERFITTSDFRLGTGDTISFLYQQHTIDYLTKVGKSIMITFHWAYSSVG